MVAKRRAGEIETAPQQPILTCCSWKTTQEDMVCCQQYPLEKNLAPYSYHTAQSSSAQLP